MGLPMIAIEDPRHDDIRALLAVHVEFARAQTPPEDAHALDLDGLLHPSVTFFAMREDGKLLGIGAIKELDDLHVELKSMHTVEEARGRGVGRAILDHMLAVARTRGVRRASLETGSMEAFAPAVALYTRAGFRTCEPFGEYRPSRNSTFMTLLLDQSPDQGHNGYAEEYSE